LVFRDENAAHAVNVPQRPVSKFHQTGTLAGGAMANWWQCGKRGNRVGLRLTAGGGASIVPAMSGLNRPCGFCRIICS
jgi:hypothetical protein